MRVWIWGALGLCAGSFTACAADRYAREESIFKGRSHCAACGHPLGAGDLVPVVSYLVLRGRCRYCGAKIPRSFLTSELELMVLFLCAGASCARDPEAVSVSLGFVLMKYMALCDEYTMTVGAYDWLWAFPLWLITRKISSLAYGLFFAAAAIVCASLLERVKKESVMGKGDPFLLFSTALIWGEKTAGVLFLACVWGIARLLVSGKKRVPFAAALYYGAAAFFLVETAGIL